MDAVYHRRGIIRPVVSVVKALASALSIGSGASIVREGPIIQIGSSFGSTGRASLAGMGGVVGGATGAAMASIVMIFEMTLDYIVIIPIKDSI